MANGDYGYFGKGDTGYAQYMTAFNRNFGGSPGGSGGNHNNGGGGMAAVRLPDRHCSGRGADPDRLGWLNQSLQVKHRFSLWGFFESDCRKQRSMVE